MLFFWLIFILVSAICLPSTSFWLKGRKKCHLMFNCGMHMHLNSKLLCRISLEQQWTIKLAQQPWDMERGILGLVSVPGGKRRSTLNTLVCTRYSSGESMCEFLLCSYIHIYIKSWCPVWENIWEKLGDEESDLFVCFV